MYPMDPDNPLATPRTSAGYTSPISIHGNRRMPILDMNADPMRKVTGSHLYELSADRKYAYVATTMMHTPLPIVDTNVSGRFPVQCTTMTQSIAPPSCTSPKYSVATYLSIGVPSFAKMLTAYVCNVDNPAKCPKKNAADTRLYGCKKLRFV
jgi:hypothetical protein